MYMPKSLAAILCYCIVLYWLNTKRRLSLAKENTTLHGGSSRMAQIRLQPPDLFKFRNPDDWPRCKRGFEQFCEASGLSEEATKRQISTFLYRLGEEAETVHSSTNATTEERNDYDQVLAKFD